MKILLLGATGRTGKLVYEIAKSKGHILHCLVRNPDKISSDEHVRVFTGCPSKITDLKRAMDGCEAIINVLNISRTWDFPWAKLRTPQYFLSDVMTKLIHLSKSNDIRRLIVCSAWGVGETRKDIPAWFRWLIDYSNIGVTYRDHERQEALLRQSDLKWTIVRPSGLINSGKAQKVIESYDNKPVPKLCISRLSLANYMVDALSNDDLIGKNPVISGY